MKHVAIALFAAASLSSASADDAPKDIDALVGQLADDDAAVRDAATASLLAAGKPALEPLKKALEAATDPEARLRLKKLVGELDARIRWTAVWEKDPADFVRPWIEGKTCGRCGSKHPWTITEISQDWVKKHFETCRIYELTWTCCKDHPERPRFFVVGPAPEQCADIHARGELSEPDLNPVPVLRALVLPAKTKEDVEDRTAAIYAMDECDAEAGLDESFRSALKMVGAKPMAGGGWFGRYYGTRPTQHATFDENGRLVEFGTDGGR